MLGVDTSSRLSVKDCLTNGMVGVDAIRKYFQSLSKNDWNLSDYPLTIQQFDTSKEQQFLPSARFKPLAWSVTVFGWGISGGGDTREEAFAQLRKHFDEYKATKPLPRPGTNKPIEFAPSVRMDAMGELAHDFAVKVLGFHENDTLFMSDESSLWDFHVEETNDTYIAKIKAAYDVDVNDLAEKGNISDILTRIQATQI